MSETQKMDEDLKKEYTLLLNNKTQKFIYRLSKAIKAKQNDRVDDLISIMKENSSEALKLKIMQYREGEDKSESLLHVAVKYEDKTDIIEAIIKLCPDLLLLAREKSDNYRGQTPLHIAITRSQEDLTKLLLTSSEQMTDNNRIQMIKTCATGRIFTNTIMMGELPLSVAVLSFDKNIVKLLLDLGKNLLPDRCNWEFIYYKNSVGDTVLHSLVKYSAVYPDKTECVIKMLKFINHHFQEYQSWFLKNNDNLTPLQLSAKLGVVEVFKFIIELEDVYSIVSAKDGLFDIKLFDITEIDTVANSMTTNDNKGYKSHKVRKNVVGISRTIIKTSPDSISNLCAKRKYPVTESILEMVFAHDYQSEAAFRIIETTPVKNIIQEKWKRLRYVYFIWGLIHFIMMICLTVEAVIRSDLYAYNSATNTSTLDKYVSKASANFANAISYLSFAFGGVFYGSLVALLILAKFSRQNAFTFIFHNLFYSLFLSFLSVSLITDFFMTVSLSYHDNIALVLAIITGWSFSIFFLRATYLFGFFTEMIRRIIFGDFLRFSVIISIMLIAFTAGIYIAFIGNIESVKDFNAYNEVVSASFSSYGATMLTMFRLMLGLDDIDILAQARIPWLATALYIIFAVLTYILLMNSLIAMMSQTCSIVCENRYPQWRLQQLSVILFLEDLICLVCLRNFFEIKLEQKRFRVFDPEPKEVFRFFFKIHSLEKVYATEEEKEAIQKTNLEDTIHFSSQGAQKRSE